MDYRSLWASLNMDLEKHDVLCAVLPSLYGDIYLTQEGRPQSMDYFDFVISEVHGLRIQELADARREGRKIFGLFCLYVPVELILAVEGVAVGICAGAQFWVPDGEKVLPGNLCPLIKASLGAWLSATCPYMQMCDFLIGETTCDGKKKAWEILGQHVPMHVMALPPMRRECDVASFGREVRLLRDELEKVSGHKVTAENLQKGVAVMQEQRAVLERIYRARQADPVPISGKDALLVSQIAFYDDPVRFNEKAARLAGELEKRVAEKQGVFPAGTPRIMITGSPMVIPNWKVHHLIETSGAAVVCEEACTGTRYFENQVEAREDLDEQLDALAQRYMQINCACFTPNERRIDDILRMVRDWRVDGVVYYSLQFCHGYAVEYHLVEQALKKAGIPVLRVETDYSDDTGQLKIRLEAFIEMLKS